MKREDNGDRNGGRKRKKKEREIGKLERVLEKERKS